MIYWAMTEIKGMLAKPWQNGNWGQWKMTVEGGPNEPEKNPAGILGEWGQE